MKDTLDRPHRHRGTDAEQAACVFLQKKGLRLLAKNFYCYFGEIDLIMQDHEDIVFVEVRLRSRVDFGSAIESVSQIKQKKLIKTAIYYLQKNKLLDKVNCRFDIIGLSHYHIDWIKDAFSDEQPY